MKIVFQRTRKSGFYKLICRWVLGLNKLRQLVSTQGIALVEFKLTRPVETHNSQTQLAGNVLLYK